MATANGSRYGPFWAVLQQNSYKIVAGQELRLTAENTTEKQVALKFQGWELYTAPCLVSVGLGDFPGEWVSLCVPIFLLVPSGDPPVSSPIAEQPSSTSTAGQ